jgi:MYXO-CTERM domain-containing protein
MSRSIVLGLLACLAPATAAASDFEVRLYGGGRVVDGFTTYVAVSADLVSGTSEQQLDVSLGAMPAGIEVTITDLSGPIYRLPASFALKVRADGAAPGSFPLSVTVTERGTLVTRTTTLDVAVDARPAPIVPAPLELTPIPMLAVWESNMRTHGMQHCAPGAIEECGIWDGCVQYYDGERVYFQIADYTGDRSFEECAQRVEGVYRDTYVIPNGGGVPGYRIFAEGLRMDFVRTGDEVSRDAALLLANHAAYSVSPVAWVVSSELSREVAYHLMARLIATSLGEADEARAAEKFADLALGHLDQWFVTGNYTGRIAPFMVGLTAEALIRWYERTSDPRVLPALMTALDWLWENAWLASEESFYYERLVGGPAPTTGAPDLNGLIAPAYAWVYRMTGDIRFRDRGDAIFAGSRNAWLDGGKQFSQTYRWTFDYVRWRTEPTPPVGTDAGAPGADAGPPVDSDGGASSPGRDAGTAPPATPPDAVEGCACSGSASDGAGAAFLLLAFALRRRRR